MILKKMMRNRIEEISFLIKNDKKKDEYLKSKKYIWSDDKIIYSNKSKYENYTRYHWRNTRHKIEVSPILGIMMNETYDSTRIKKLLDENYSRILEQLYKSMYLSSHKKLIKALDNKPYDPLEYAKKLTADFLNEIKEGLNQI